MNLLCTGKPLRLSNKETFFSVSSIPAGVLLILSEPTVGCYIGSACQPTYFYRNGSLCCRCVAPAGEFAYSGLSRHLA